MINFDYVGNFELFNIDLHIMNGYVQLLCDFVHFIPIGTTDHKDYI